MQEPDPADPAHPPASPEGETQHPDEPLTPREQVLVRLMAQGLGSRAIADRLGLSERTVRRLMAILLQRLELRGDPDAVGVAPGAGGGSAAAEKARQTRSRG
ncbi:LuxR C-terminal-related transcriptional regulator [Streptomyces sp. NPDC051921]|uniref:helix-turn-helix domain-containing protein n=1 Tax=Streptomyces sp. NPDC051921 TaxID=3155806 RepID=UPI0034239CC2